MKKLVLYILCISVNLAFAQNINQFDSNGKRHGIWKKNFDKTRILRYEGEFNHGKEIGAFKFYQNINKEAVLTATKKFNKANTIAKVKFFSSKGKLISEGQMNGKTYIGTWKYYQAKSKRIMTLEHYDDNGLLQNERNVYYEKGQLAEKKIYKDNKLHGISVWYSEKGVLIREFSYENGELHGISKHYGPEGDLILEGYYQHDRKHGIWKYYKEGKLMKETDFTRRTKNPYKKKN